MLRMVQASSPMFTERPKANDANCWAKQYWLIWLAPSLVAMSTTLA